MTYEAPEILEIGLAEEVILSCSCSGCDCGGGKMSTEEL